MSHRPVSNRNAERTTRSVSAPIARTYRVKVAVDRLLKVDVDRQRRIDHYIDYFGDGAARPSVVT